MNTRHHYLSLLRTFALATLTAAAVAACTDDNGDPAGNEPITPADGIPVTFTANINPGSDADPAGAPDTRTVLEPDGNGGFTVKWKGKDTYSYSSDKIYIWAAMGNTLANNGNYKIYVPTTSDVSSALESYDGPLTLTDPGEWKFTATYSRNIVNGAPNVFLDYQTQSAPGKTDHIAENDFSVATATKHVETGDMPQIGLQFKHQLSALQLHVTNQSGEALTVKEIRLSVTEDQIVSQKIYDLATEDWKADGEDKKDYLKLTITTPAALASNDGTAQDFHMLLFPEPAHGGTDMTVTVITDRGEYTLTKTAPSGGFLAGKNYMTNIAIKSTPGTGETWTEYVGISTPQELAAFSSQVNDGTDNYAGKTVRLLNNITLTGTWTPIGTDENKPFSGTFDGGKYHISGLNVNTTENYAGLFGSIKDGTVRNLRVKGTVKTTGNFYAGGIVGYLDGSTVENCIFEGEVSGKNAVGGIVGSSLANCRIAGCHTKGTVTATSDYAGGIAGDNAASSCIITDCYSEAKVTTSGLAGGIIGYNNGTITRCYATGQVSGKNNVGGIVGQLYAGTVKGCIALNSGLTRTEGDKTTFGRIVGHKQQNSTVDNCAAFSGMTIKDATSNATITSGATSVAGDDLTAAACLTKTTYTDREFTTDNGWAFDSGTWTYLPWNQAFASFSDIWLADYRIEKAFTQP